MVVVVGVKPCHSPVFGPKPPHYAAATANTFGSTLDSDLHQRGTGGVDAEGFGIEK